MRGTAVAGAAIAGSGVLYAQSRTDTEPRTLDGQPVPEPPADKSAGPVKPGRGSALGGKVAVVTGAARGIGRAIAVEFAANGADVVLIDIAGPVSVASDAKPATPADLEETLRQVKAYGRKGETIRLDIRDLDALRKAADRIDATYGKIDIVVANAAIQRWKSLLEMQDAEWRDVIDNNLNGTANTIRAFAPKMVPKRRGRIIVLSSMQGKHGTKDGSSYSASKWGILGLMKSAALELGEYNITVNAVVPGLVDTALTRYEKRLTESMAAELRAKGINVNCVLPSIIDTPPNRASMPKADFTKWVAPAALADVILFLASDQARAINGAAIPVVGLV